MPLPWPPRVAVLATLAALAAAPVAGQPPAPEAPPPCGDWPMYGGTPGRNMANFHDRDILRAFDAAKGIPVLWKAELGSRCYAQPVVAGGRVYVGTNNERPRNPRDARKGADGVAEPIDKGVLMCFDAATGKFLWQAVHDKLETGQVNDWPREGLVSIPAVEADRVYYVSNRCTVVCADARGFADGNQGFPGETYRDHTDADVLWEYDMRKELGVFPHNMSSGCPLIVGDVLVTITGNGVDEGHVKVPAPDAPSLIALDKTTGKLLWKSAAPGRNIMHAQWAPPSFAADPVPQVIVGQGDGWLRAFDPPTGRLLWAFDCNPKGAVYELGGTGTRSDFIAAPVAVGGRVFIGVGQDPEHFSGVGHLWCIDLAKAVANGATAADRDVSPELVVRVEKWPGGRRRVVTRPNPASALAWHYGGAEPRKWAPRDFKFGRTLSTVSVVGDVVYAAELQGFLHCLDARTGRHYWQYDLKGAVWTASYYVDGRVLVGTENGDLFVFRHDPHPEVIDELDVPAADAKGGRRRRLEQRKRVEDKYLMGRFEFDAAIRGTPSVAGGVLYLATEKDLYAVKKAP